MTVTSSEELHAHVRAQLMMMFITISARDQSSKGRRRIWAFERRFWVYACWKFATVSLVALRLRSLRFHSPRLCRVAVFLIQTNVSLTLIPNRLSRSLSRCPSHSFTCPANSRIDHRTPFPRSCTSQAPQARAAQDR